MTSRIFAPAAGALPPSADVVIVGGGIVGAATAFYAARAGLGAVLVERRGGLATLTTTRSLEAFRAQFEDPADIAMMRESIAVFERFADEVGVEGCDISLHQQGYLFVTQAEDGAERCAARVAAQRAGGLDDVELLSGEEARRRFPFLAPDVSGACFRQRDGWLASHEATHGFAHGAKNAQFLLETTVTGFDAPEGRLRAVVTDKGRIETPRAVIAAGPYSGRVAALAGMELPFSAVRRHRAGVNAHPAIPRDAPMCVSLDDGSHWRPEGPGAYLGWSGALEEQPAPPSDHIAADWTFPALAIHACTRFTPFWAEIGRTLVASNVTVEAGQYDLTPDAHPIIGRSDAVEGVFLNCGYSGHGVMGSPGGARLLVDVMLGKLPEERNPFRLGRLRGDVVRPRAPL